MNSLLGRPRGYPYNALNFQPVSLSANQPELLAENDSKVFF